MHIHTLYSQVISHMRNNLTPIPWHSTQQRKKVFFDSDYIGNKCTAMHCNALLLLAMLLYSILFYSFMLERGVERSSLHIWQVSC